MYLKDPTQPAKEDERKKARRASAKLPVKTWPLRRSQRPATLSASQKISALPVESPAEKAGPILDAAYEPDSEASGKRFSSQWDHSGLTSSLRCSCVWLSGCSLT